MNRKTLRLQLLFTMKNQCGSFKYTWQTKKPSPWVGVSGAVRGTASYGSVISGSDRQFCHYTDRKHQAFRVARRGRVNCRNVFRMNSNNVLFVTKRTHAHMTHS